MKFSRSKAGFKKQDSVKLALAEFCGPHYPPHSILCHELMLNGSLKAEGNSAKLMALIKEERNGKIQGNYHIWW